MSKVSISGSRSRSACTASAPNARSPMIAASIVTKLRPRRNSGISGIGGICMIRAEEVTSSGTGQRPLAPGVHDLGGALPRPPHRAGVELGHGVEGDLHRGHDAEAAAAAAQRPEQVRVVVGVDAAQPPVGGHDLDRQHAVGGQAVLAAEPADAAAEAVADHADVGRGAGQRGEAVLGGGLGDLEPQRAGGDAGAARLGVDLDAAHARGAEQDRVLEVAERAGVVAGALRGDAQPVAARVLDDRDHVVGALGEGDERGPLVVREVPGPAGLVPVRVGGADDEASDAVAGGGESGGGVEHGRDPRRGPDRRASGDSLSSFAMPATDLVAFVRATLPPPPARVLEIGAGDGELAAALAAAGYDVVAIDPASEVETVRPVPLHELDEEPFDAAVAVVSLHHVEPLGESLERLGALRAARRGAGDRRDRLRAVRRAGRALVARPPPRPPRRPGRDGRRRARAHAPARAPERGAGCPGSRSASRSAARTCTAGTCPPTCATRRRR